MSLWGKLYRWYTSPLAHFLLHWVSEPPSRVSAQHRCQGLHQTHPFWPQPCCSPAAQQSASPLVNVSGERQGTLPDRDEKSLWFLARPWLFFPAAQCGPGTSEYLGYEPSTALLCVVETNSSQRPSVCWFSPPSIPQDSASRSPGTDWAVQSYSVQGINCSTGTGNWQKC